MHLRNNNYNLLTKTMSNLNQVQKKYLKTVTNVEQWKKLPKAFEKVNSEIAYLTKEQIYCIDNTLYTR